MTIQANTMTSDLGTYIAREIKQRGWSQRTASSKLNVPFTTLNNVIHGRNSPDLATLRKLADGLKVSVVRLLELGGVSIGAEETETPGAYRALTESDRAFIDSLSAEELRDFIDYARKQRQRYQS